MKKIVLVALLCFVAWIFFHEEKEIPVTESESASGKTIKTNATPEVKAEAPFESAVEASAESPAETPVVETHVPTEKEIPLEPAGPDVPSAVPEKSVLKELPTENISDILKKSEKLTEIPPGPAYFVPGCYTGEYYPYVGKPDRLEVELFLAATGDSAGRPFKGQKPWRIYSKSYLFIKKLGEIVREYGPDSFQKPPQLEKGTYGALVVDPEKAIYQFAGKEGKIQLTYYEKAGDEWRNLSTVSLTLSSGQGECPHHLEMMAN